MNARNTESGGGTAPGKRGVTANISYITGRVWTGGDLPSDLGEEAMLADLVAIQRAGITDILDNRIEWSDAEFIAAHAPDMYYLWDGADDAGQVMPDQWFSDGVDFALTALEDPGAQVLAQLAAVTASVMLPLVGFPTLWSPSNASCSRPSRASGTPSPRCGWATPTRLRAGSPVPSRIWRCP